MNRGLYRLSGIYIALSIKYTEHRQEIRKLAKGKYRLSFHPFYAGQVVRAGDYTRSSQSSSIRRRISQLHRSYLVGHLGSKYWQYIVGTYRMLLNLRRLTVVSLLTVFFNTNLWREVEAQTTGGSPSSTAANTTSTSTTDAAPTAPTLESFLISSLRWKCSPEESPANYQIQRVVLTYIYSCSNRCGLDERDASSGVFNKNLSRCYCDKLCDDFGDCCFDFNALCRKSVNPQGSPLSLNETCLAQDNLATFHGYAVWNTCLKNWTESSVRQMCQHEDQSDRLKNLPVFDKDSHVTYKNIFCARCNGAINTTNWKLQFHCPAGFNTTGSDSSHMMNLLLHNCSVKKTPEEFQLKYLKRCIPRFQDCFNVSQEKNALYCQTECLRYAFPSCINRIKKRFRNPQCALCNGVKPNKPYSVCDEKLIGIQFFPLTILFHFNSTSKYSIVEYANMHRGTHRQSYEKSWSCAHDEVYDPYSAKCRKIVSVGPHNANAQNTSGATNKTDLYPNCTFIHFNKSDYEQLTNGTVYIKPHNKIYSNTSYTVDDDGLLLCVNSSRNGKAFGEERIVLGLLTTIGCITSMVSLALLLITYILFPELRNLPGKIIINLAFSLLLFQSVFFSAAKTSNQEQCFIVAVLLHFFALCSFTWMNVMAYDVHRVFTASDGVATNQHDGNNKRLIKYCLYAWGAPALVVSICVIIDQVVEEGSIGYGRGETLCFISEHRAKVFSFDMFVAIVMLFNVVALGHTVVHIVKTRKRAQQVSNQRHGMGIALICVKLASVMGVTWILGIAANIEALAFLRYPFVVLGSLQGLFIFLSFAASGRALKLYKNKVSMLKCLKARRGPAQDAHRETRV